MKKPSHNEPSVNRKTPDMKMRIIKEFVSVTDDELRSVNDFNKFFESKF